MNQNTVLWKTLVPGHVWWNSGGVSIARRGLVLKKPIVTTLRGPNRLKQFIAMVDRGFFVDKNAAQRARVSLLRGLVRGAAIGGQL